MSSNVQIQLQTHIKNVKVFKCVLNYLVSFSPRIEMAETQTQALIIQLAEIQCKFNSQPQRVSEVKLRALIGKE